MGSSLVERLSKLAMERYGGHSTVMLNIWSDGSMQAELFHTEPDDSEDGQRYRRVHVSDVTRVDHEHKLLDSLSRAVPKRRPSMPVQQALSKIRRLERQMEDLWRRRDSETHAEDIVFAPGEYDRFGCARCPVRAREQWSVCAHCLRVLRAEERS